MLGPSLHALKKQADLADLNPVYTARLVSIAKSLRTAQVPTIFSLMHLASLTFTPWSNLRASINRETNDYQVFEIRKRSGGKRRICAPKPILKTVQRWIHAEILTSPGALLRVHPASSAYSPGSAIVKNARIHTGCTWLIKLDIKDFFESISERQVSHVFRSLGYAALLSFEMSRLCTRTVPPRSSGVLRTREKTWRWTNSKSNNAQPYATTSQVGHLPQGAPTSAMLANLVFATMDTEIQKIADRSGAAYTRYADDIVLSLGTSSRSNCNEIFQSVAGIVTHSGFRVNRLKSHISGPGARKVVTGLIVNDIVPRLARSTKDEIELALYCIKKHGLLSHANWRHSNNPLGYLNHLTGLIYFARSIEPEFGKRAMSKLAVVLQPHSELLEMLQSLNTSKNNSAFCFS